MRRLALPFAAATAIAVGLGGAALSVSALTGADPGADRLSERWRRGVNLTAFLPEAYAEEQARRAMLTARATGTELVALTPTSYMESATSSEISADPAKTPSDESLISAAREAQALGLKVVIKPHVDVLDGTFRGEIAPADRVAWFADYGALIEHYAELASEVDADGFVVGTELTSMAGDEEAWRDLIRRVRTRFPGDLTFAANWVEGAEQIAFWDDLDAIGIDAYMPLAPEFEQPGVEELVTAWEPYEARMGALASRYRKPVVFTELGFQSRIGTAARVGEDEAPISEQAQADAYQATFEALADQPWFNGIWWWEWSAEGLGIGPGDGGWSPEGKQAAEVLEDWQR